MDVNIWPKLHPKLTIPSCIFLALLFEPNPLWKNTGCIFWLVLSLKVLKVLKIAKSLRKKWKCSYPTARCKIFQLFGTGPTQQGVAPVKNTLYVRPSVFGNSCSAKNFVKVCGKKSSKCCGAFQSENLNTLLPKTFGRGVMQRIVLNKRTILTKRAPQGGGTANHSKGNLLSSGQYLIQRDNLFARIRWENVGGMLSKKSADRRWKVNRMGSGLARRRPVGQTFANLENIQINFSIVINWYWV